MSHSFNAQQRATEPMQIDMHAATSEFDDFVYLISHDVRNSVRALIELPQWIEEDLLEAGIGINGSVGQSIDLMNRHTGRLDRMLVDLLAFSRVGRMQDVCDIDLDLALSDLLEEMRIPQGFTIHADLVSNRLSLGERDARTLLTQLISNAIKHHDRATGKVLVTLHEEAGHAVLRVLDDGPGIEAKYRERVFAAMSTLRPRDEVEGSGMGLAIVRRIAQHYGGRIAVGAGLDGGGTMIEIRLPLHDTRASWPEYQA